MRRAFTLVELIIVVIIIGILVTFAMPAFRTTKEHALDSEAKASLKLIQAAQKIYKMETDSYYPPSGSQSDITIINQNLKLSLPAGSARNWNYVCWSTGCSRATRNGGDGRSWYLAINDADGEPNSGTGCP
jgi:general secretion pathway protein G